MIILQQPSKIVFGLNSVEKLPEDDLILSSDKILMLVAQPLVEILKPLINSLTDSKKTIEMISYGFPGEPTFSQFDQLLEKSDSFNPDCVIGIGGGSVLDSAKLLAAMTGNVQKYADVVGVGLLKKRMKKLICIPTTSGTGSEVSPIAILLNEKTEAKSGIVSQALIADAAYIDPLLTVGLPPKITAETGMDALCHCIEAFTNKFAHPAVDMYALAGIKLIADNLLAACQDGTNSEARAALALGSMYGGLCLGPVNTHAVHCLSYGLGGKFHISHGLANAVLLPSVLKFNLDASPERHAAVAIALGVEKQENDVATALAGIAKIELLAKKCGIPDSLKKLGIYPEDFPALADIAMGVTRLLKNNPKPLSREDAIQIYSMIE
jgi:alcohol dehydrogenase class IV